MKFFSTFAATALLGSIAQAAAVIPTITASVGCFLLRL